MQIIIVDTNINLIKCYSSAVYTSNNGQVPRSQFFYVLLLYSCIFKGFRAGTQLSWSDDSLQFLIHIHTLTANYTRGTIFYSDDWDQLPTSFPSRFRTGSFLHWSPWTKWRSWTCHASRISKHKTWFTGCTGMHTWWGTLGTTWSASWSCFWILFLFYVFFEQWIPGQTSCGPDCFKSL